MPKGILKLSKTAKGKIIVALDRLNGKPPMPLSSVSLPDMTHNDKECEFGFDKGVVTYIKVDGVQIYPSVSVALKPAQQGNQYQERPLQQGQQANRAAQTSTHFADSFLVKDTLLPKDVRGLSVSDIDNFNLKFHKAARSLPDNKGNYKFYFYSSGNSISPAPNDRLRTRPCRRGCADIPPSVP